MAMKSIYLFHRESSAIVNDNQYVSISSGGGGVKSGTVAAAAKETSAPQPREA